MLYKKHSFHDFSQYIFVTTPREHQNCSESGLGAEPPCASGSGFPFSLRQRAADVFKASVGVWGLGFVYVCFDSQFFECRLQGTAGYGGKGLGVMASC